MGCTAHGRLGTRRYARRPIYPSRRDACLHFCPAPAVSPEVAPAISEWKAATADREANEFWGEKRDLRLDYAHAAAAPARPAVTNGVTRNAERDELQRAMQELRQTRRVRSTELTAPDAAIRSPRMAASEAYRQLKQQQVDRID